MQRWRVASIIKMLKCKQKQQGDKARAQARKLAESLLADHPDTALARQAQAVLDKLNGPDN